MLWATGCADDEKQAVPYIDNCQLINGSVKWNFDGASYCADANIIAGYAIGLTVNGITQTGITFTMEIDSLTPGSYIISQDNNNIVYTDQTGFAWTTMDNNAGTITITSHDTILNKVEGNFSCMVKSPILGITKQITNGSMKVTYVE